MPILRVMPALLAAALLGVVASGARAAALGTPGAFAVYDYRPAGGAPASVVERLAVTLGPLETVAGRDCQWYRLDARKANGQRFTAWLLVDGFPPLRADDARKSVFRYLLQEGDAPPLEYVNAFTGEAALPMLGYWGNLLPRAAGAAAELFPAKVEYLGLPMTRGEAGTGAAFAPPRGERLALPGDLRIGTIYSVREQDKTRRRFDGKGEIGGDMVPCTREDYLERFAVGQTLFTVPADQQELVARRNVFYYTADFGGADVLYPESLYRSNYLGPYPGMLDEPAVLTWFNRVKPQLAKDPGLGRRMTPQYMFDQFAQEFQASRLDRPGWFIAGLKKRGDVDAGALPPLLAGTFSWEVFISTAAWQLSGDRHGPPDGIVYESRLCADRDLPFLDSIAGIQLPTGDLKALLDVYIAALRGAARVSGKRWGISIYRGQQIGEIPAVLKYAYDAGASWFLFWTGEIPYAEQLDYARYLHDYALAHPDRDMAALRRAAEVMILFPPGYEFHTFGLSREEGMWMNPALHLERINRAGVPCRQVLHAVGQEIERCYRQGVGYDLAWEIDGLDLSGYREVVRVREDGSVRVTGADGREQRYRGPRPVARPPGAPPGLAVTLSVARGRAPLAVTANAAITEGASPVVFTPRCDETGAWRNLKVIWQLYGPEEWDYDKLDDAPATLDGATCRLALTLAKPGRYRLRASVVDRAGRATVCWREIRVD